MTNSARVPAIVALIAFAVTANHLRGDDSKTLPDTEEVRRLLMPNDNLVVGGEDGKPLRPHPLLKFGDRLFPAYEDIIADPKSDVVTVANAFSYVGDIKGDRKRFIPLALGRLTDSFSAVRLEAVRLLGQIGNERDTAPIIALLSDGDLQVRRDAAKALVKIGGKNDIVAISIWLKTGNYQNDVRHLQHVKDCRDALEKRLKDAPKEDKK